jgi:hypothetical protein
MDLWVTIGGIFRKRLPISTVWITRITKSVRLHWLDLLSVTLCWRNTNCHYSIIRRHWYRIEIYHPKQDWAWLTASLSYRSMSYRRNASGESCSLIASVCKRILVWVCYVTGKAISRSISIILKLPISCNRTIHWLYCIWVSIIYWLGSMQNAGSYVRGD